MPRRGGTPRDPVNYDRRIDPETGHPVVLFDGFCGMCSGSVRFMVKRDPGRRLRFAPVQSEAGKRLLASVPPESLPYGGLLSDGTPGTMVLLDGGRVYTQSDSTLRMAGYLRFPWSLLAWLRIVPRPLRDTGYRFIARNRHRLSRKRSACYMPAPGEAERFLN